MTKGVRRSLVCAGVLGLAAACLLGTKGGRARTGGAAEAPTRLAAVPAAAVAPTAEEEPVVENVASAAETEEARVEAFDDLTDKWRAPAKAGVSVKDVEDFVAAFRQVPKDRRDECVHRALNLVPDENALLLAGILMDKTMDRETVATVFHDILNRDEDVKRPILRQVVDDKSHPCRADAKWILDVTGEKQP